MKTTFLSLLFGLLAFGARAQRIDTVEVFSPSMRKAIRNVVIRPSDYDLTADSLPVVYLLHGYHRQPVVWTDICPSLPQLVERHRLIVVCPEGENSWYLDSPVRPESRYETYVARELVDGIDARYRTRRDRHGRAITGFSMGGHGALWLAFRHQETFGACGATSGGVDIRPFPQSWELDRLLGDYASHPSVWDDHTVMTQLHRLRPGGLAIVFDCGTGDFFFAVNQRLHRELTYRNIGHRYTTSPGGHDNAYWSRTFPHHFLFFDDYFRSSEQRGA